MQKIRTLILQFRIVGVLTVVLLHQISAVFVYKEKLIDNPFDTGATMVSFLSKIVPADSNCIDVTDNESEAPLQSSSEMEDEIPHFNFCHRAEKVDLLNLHLKLKCTLNCLLIPQDFVEIHSPPPDVV